MHSPQSLAEQLAARAARIQGDGQFWLGVAGPPGAGKSTLCRALLAELGEAAVVVPMDGYHYYRRQLDRMDDPREAHRRRGAPFTFDAERFVREVAEARAAGEGAFPSFDHAAGDPVERDVRLVRGRRRIVIVEGNYLLLDEPPWRRLRELFDETWYLDVDLATCQERVRQRHIATGQDAESARRRVEANDGPNAELVARVSPARADRIIQLT